MLLKCLNTVKKVNVDVVPNLLDLLDGNKKNLILIYIDSKTILLCFAKSWCKER